MSLVPIANCIRHWDSTLFHNRGLLSPDMRVLIEATIQHLRELKTLKEKEVKS